MPLFKMSQDELVECKPVTFARLEIREREGLQHVLRDRVDVLADDLLVISEEFGDWEDARRRIDLLALDKQRRLVVIELKRTETGGHMELQAIRYAAMVAAMTFHQVVAAHEAYLRKRGRPADGAAESEIREFLELPPDEDAEVSSDVRIVLVSGDFSREITTAVLWLNQFEGMDIRCIRLVPYEIDQQNYLDIEQIIPLPEALDYQVQVRRKDKGQEKVRQSGADWTRYVIVASGAASPPLRKRQAVLSMMQRLAERGVPLVEMATVIPTRLLRVLPTEISDPSAVAPALLEHGVNEPQRYFTEAAFIEGGQTYVLSKMWGLQTEPTLAELRDRFTHAGVSFQAAD